MDKQDQLPEAILEHVEECLECKVEIMEVLELVEAIGSQPTFDSTHEQ